MNDSASADEQHPVSDDAADPDVVVDNNSQSDTHFDADRRDDPD